MPAPKGDKSAEGSRGGRPSDYTPEIAADICCRIEEGETIRDICGRDGMPSWPTVRRWLREKAEFRTQYAHAREESAAVLEHRVLEEADKIADGEGAQVARVRIDALKWVAGKRAPKVYGDRMLQEHTGSVAVGHFDLESLSEAERDALRPILERIAQQSGGGTSGPSQA